jgi:hypothetical protein
VLGSGYYGSYLYNNAGGYSSGAPTNPVLQAPELNEAQAMPLIDFPLYHGPQNDINDPQHRPGIFSPKWARETSAKEKTFDVLMAGITLVAIGVITTFAIKGLLISPGNAFRDLTRHR